MSSLLGVGELPPIKGLADLGDLKNKKVLVRSDLNVPIQNGEISDDYRILCSLPTLKYLKAAGADITVCSHLGRPKGKVVSALSLDPVHKKLAELLGEEVRVLDNLRFSAGETANSSDFIQELIQGQEIYVNDAFGACHRAHASIVGPPKYLPSVAGLLLEKEIEVMGGLLEQQRKPFVVVIGGAKVSDKLGVIQVLLEKADALLIGGAMAFTFLRAQGAQLNDPLVEEGQIQHIANLLKSDLGAKIHLPEDFTGLSSEGEVRQMGANTPEGWQLRDIGPGTAAAFTQLIDEAGSVFWNGPMGVFEDPRFVAGTRTIAEAMGNTKAYTVVGGGDSASALRAFGLDKEVDYLSTGGGATLEFIENGNLVGIQALQKA